MSAAKELAARLRFLHAPRRDRFRRSFLWLGLLAVAVGAAGWFGMVTVWGEGTYLPEPVATNHATFGERCEHCHAQAYAAVEDGACLTCHVQRPADLALASAPSAEGDGWFDHTPFENRTPACRECHVEHRGEEVFLRVADSFCVECHGDLEAERRGPAHVAEDITTFASHPEIEALRRPGGDRTALRFNHDLHLTSSDVQEPLDCVSCHLVSADGERMVPISFELHCERCHEQTPSTPAGLSVTVVHEEPEAVRRDLEQKLARRAIRDPESIFLAGPKLVGRAQRPPLSEARDLGEFLTGEIATLERALYAPLEGTTRLNERNRFCFLCHDAVGGASPGAVPERAAGELPQIDWDRPVRDPRVADDSAGTALPERWLTRSEFSHRAHEVVDCESCHDGARTSHGTEDVNLPAIALCQRCHVDGAAESAGTECMLCHLYHETSRRPALRREREKELEIEVLLGEAEPPTRPAS